jgi:hypothetical protein
LASALPDMNHRTFFWPLLALCLVGLCGPAVADPITLHASGTCPSSEAVTNELTRLALDSPPAPDLRVDIFETSRGLRVQLRRAAGEASDERVLQTGEDCGERALAAAVVIASWLTDLRSDVKLDLEPSRPSWFPSVGLAGVAVTSATGNLAWGGELDLQLIHRSGWGARLVAWGTSFRSVGLGDSPGRASWTRGALSLGPVYELDRGRLVFAFAAQFALAGLKVRGEDLALTRQDTSVDLGGRLGVEAGWRWGAFVPCAQIAAVAWPHAQRVKALGVNGERTLPELDILFALGFRWGRGP